MSDPWVNISVNFDFAQVTLRSRRPISLWWWPSSSQSAADSSFSHRCDKHSGLNSAALYGAWRTPVFMWNAVKWLTPTLQKLNLWIFCLFKPLLLTPNSKYTISNTKCPITETYEKNTCRELKVDDKRRKLPKHQTALAEQHRSPHRTPSHCTVTGWRYCNCNTIIGISSNGVIPVMVDWQVQ